MPIKSGISNRWRSLRPAGYCLIAFLLPLSLYARDSWSELNIGPFRVDYRSDEAKARDTLADLEQLRWILGGMLENKDLTATWPFRILLTDSPGARDITLAHSQYVVAIRPGDALPLREIASIFIKDNTPPLPREVDASLPLLFDGLTARGSRAIWAKPPAKPDLNWARLHLFVTTPEYVGRFPVFLNNLRGGAPLVVAEANAFGKDSKTLEAEVSSYFLKGGFQSLTTSARPLDPKHDFGIHSLDTALANLYLADTKLGTEPKFADQAYKEAAEAGYKPLAQEGFALLVIKGGGDAREYLDNAMGALTKSAWVYGEAAREQPAPVAISSLRTARELNPKWWVPSARLAELTTDKKEKEELLQEACNKNPRLSELWQKLAELQSAEGKGKAAQNSWIRAEDAAPSQEAREAIEHKKTQIEGERLDAEEKVRRDAREAETASNQKAEDAMLARIHAAEKRANAANSETGDSDASSGEVLPWFGTGEKPLEASLVRVDCLDSRARLSLRAADRLIKLLVIDPAHISIEGTAKELGCGVQEPTRRVSVAFKPRKDTQFGTAGDVTAIRFE